VHIYLISVSQCPSYTTATASPDWIYPAAKSGNVLSAPSLTYGSYSYIRRNDHDVVKKLLCAYHIVSRSIRRQIRTSFVTESINQKTKRTIRPLTSQYNTLLTLHTLQNLIKITPVNDCLKVKSTIRCKINVLWQVVPYTDNSVVKIAVLNARFT